MSLVHRLQSDQLQARKSKDSATLSVLQMILSQVKNAQIEYRVSELTDTQTIEVLRKFKKQLQDALTDFTHGGRVDLQEQMQRELDIVQRYLPVEITEAEIENIIREVIATYSEVTQKDFGRVMGKVMSVVDGRADGAKVQAIVKKLLQN